MTIGIPAYHLIEEPTLINQDNIFNMKFDKQNKRFILVLKNFPPKFICYECSLEIKRDEKKYYCRQLGRLFHRECVIKSKHQQKFLSSLNPQHNDYLVEIEKKENKKDE